MNYSFEEFKKHWNYFLRLDKKLFELGGYVEFDLDTNGETYSTELMSLYMLICSEIDSMGNILAGNSNKRNKNIAEWFYAIQGYDVMSFSDIHKKSFGNSVESKKINEYKVYFLGNIPISPWENFEAEEIKKDKGSYCYEWKNENKTHKWWTHYNNVKHQRAKFDNFKKAKLENVMYAFSALYILELAYATKISEKQEISFVDRSYIFGGDPTPMTGSEINKILNE